MLKNNHYYKEKASQLFKDTEKATKEVKRLLDTIKLEDIEHIKHNTNTQNTHNYYITLTDNKVYCTDKMNKQTFETFNKLLPLHKHEKMEDPTITKGLLQGVANPDKVFKSFK